MHRLVRFVVVAAALLLQPAAAQAQRTVSITLDDLPYAVEATLPDVAAATDALLAALAAHRAPADVFVTGRSVEGEVAARTALLRRWRQAGHGVHNHGYGHLPYSATAPDVYLADTQRGQVLLDGLFGLDDGAARSRFFRPPFNDLGESDTPRTVLAALLDRQGVRLAPFTVEHSDYVFNAVYRDALARRDTATARRVGEAYLVQLDSAFAFAERLSVDTFGREIPQVLLLHANALNAVNLGPMLDCLAKRGYAFVPLTTAVQDPAYATPDRYTRKWGVSWLHRWRTGLGRPSALRDEPEPPAWITEAYDALGR